MVVADNDETDFSEDVDQSTVVRVGPDWGGGLYNLLFGDGMELERGWAVVAHTLKYASTEEVDEEWYQLMRYRDCWLEEDDEGLRIAVLTRLGRPKYEQVRELMRAHPNWLYDKALTSDDTYIAFYFSVPGAELHSPDDLPMVEETIQVIKDQQESLAPRDLDNFMDVKMEEAMQRPDTLRALADTALKQLGVSGAQVHIEAVNVDSEEGKARLKQLKERYGKPVVDLDPFSQNGDEDE